VWANSGFMTEAEKTLIAGCVRGDKAVWDAFVQQFSSLVYSTIYKTLTLHHASPHDQGEVEDLFQEFFVSCLCDDCRKLRQFRGERGITKGQAVTYTLSDGKKIQKVTDVVTERDRWCGR
jgi:hypothetical protein